MDYDLGRIFSFVKSEALFFKGHAVTATLDNHGHPFGIQPMREMMLHRESSHALALSRD
jgi:hypothetical protein